MPSAATIPDCGPPTPLQEIRQITKNQIIYIKINKQSLHVNSTSA